MIATLADRRKLISVIVPTWNRPEALGDCLSALSRSTFPAGDFEVIVVDDGGAMPLDTVVEEHRTTLDLTLIRQDNAGPSAARNRGARAAQGKLLAFTDDDCRPGPSWLGALAKAHHEFSGRLLGGRTENALPDNPYSATSQLILDLVYEQCNKEPGNATFVASNNMAVPTAGFHQLGGFNEAFRTAEDRDLCARWRKVGHPLLYVPEALVSHAHRLTLSRFCRQHFAYGMGAFAFHRGRPAGAIGYSTSFHSDPRKWLFQPLKRGLPRPGLLMALLGLWEVVNAAGFCWAALRASAGPRAAAQSGRK